MTPPPYGLAVELRKERRHGAKQFLFTLDRDSMKFPEESVTDLAMIFTSMASSLGADCRTPDSGFGFPGAGSRNDNPQYRITA